MATIQFPNDFVVRQLPRAKGFRWWVVCLKGREHVIVSRHYSQQAAVNAAGSYVRLHERVARFQDKLPKQGDFF